MLEDPIAILEPVREMMKIDKTTLEMALSKASADTKPNGKFFWKQQKKNYLNYLTREQINLFLEYRGEDCRELGYPPEDF
ncbi:hypothetical protein ROS217_05749 [Roseovarius sp. 217]|nr:hypothetical protein ROS217_05749 [Roseovarius sp. 217]